MKAKGVGELGICGVGAAVANAIYNATGVRVRDYPITLDKLLGGHADDGLTHLAIFSAAPVRQALRDGRALRSAEGRTSWSERSERCATSTASSPSRSRRRSQGAPAPRDPVKTDAPVRPVRSASGQSFVANCAVLMRCE